MGHQTIEHRNRRVGRNSTWNYAGSHGCGRCRQMIVSWTSGPLGHFLTPRVSAEPDNHSLVLRRLPCLCVNVAGAVPCVHPQWSTPTRQPSGTLPGRTELVATQPNRTGALDAHKTLEVTRCLHVVSPFSSILSFLLFCCSWMLLMSKWSHIPLIFMDWLALFCTLELTRSQSSWHLLSTD